MPFQTQVGIMPAPAVEGDFCDTNPRYTYDAGPGGVVSGSNSGISGISGLVVGRFAWATSPLDADNTPAVANNTGSGQVTGFVHREQQGLFTAYLQEVTMAQPPGFPATLFTGGGFWVVNRGTNEAQVGMKAYANFVGGAVTFNNTGSVTNSATTTAGTVTAGTNSFIGSISNNLLNVSTVLSGTIYSGTSISASGITAGTSIISQAGGTIGQAGSYYVSVADQSIASGTTINGTYGLFTAGGTVTGTFVVGGTISGSGVASNTAITQAISGTTFAVNNNTTIGSESITQAGNVETKWYATSAGPAGALIKISDKQLG